MATEHHSEDPVLAEIRLTREDIAVLNTRLFGERDGTSSDGGRLVRLETTVGKHESQISWLQKIMWGGMGAAAVFEFLHAVGLVHFGK